jgi:hypothetical protein
MRLDRVWLGHDVVLRVRLAGVWLGHDVVLRVRLDLVVRHRPYVVLRVGLNCHYRPPPCVVWADVDAAEAAGS